MYIPWPGSTLRSGTATQAIYYASNIAAAAANANVVTVKFSASAPYPDIRIAEYSGIATSSPVDAAAGASGSSASSSSGSVTTKNATTCWSAATMCRPRRPARGPGTQAE